MASQRNEPIPYGCSLKFLGSEGGALCESNFGKDFDFRRPNYFPKSRTKFFYIYIYVNSVEGE